MNKPIKAVVVENKKLVLGETQLANLSEKQALIRVHAAGVNHADIYQRNGEYPVPKGASEILGLEVAGEIVAIGSTVKAFKIGQRVMALVPGGGYAEYCVVDEETTLPLPEKFSYVQGAAIAEAYYTIQSNLFAPEMAGLKSGETLLVHGGASGIGSVTIQMAKAMGVRVIATAGSSTKADACRKLGANLVIEYKKTDFFKAIQEFTQPAKGVDVIFDWVGTEYFEKHVQLLKRFGRLVIIDSHTGDDAKLDLMALLTRNLHVMGSVLRRRPMEEKLKITEQIKKIWLPLINTGKLDPLIHGTFELKDAQKAHDLMEQSGHMGKIVLLC